MSVHFWLNSGNSFQQKRRSFFAFFVEKQVFSQKTLEIVNKFVFLANAKTAGKNSKHLENLKKFISRYVSLSLEEAELINDFFEEIFLTKNQILLKEGDICRYIYFLREGKIRHFHIKENGEEKTCDFTFENSFLTDFQSFIQEKPSILHFIAISPCRLLRIRRDNLFRLYQICNKYDTFGRMMAEEIAQKATETAMSLATDKPEERYRKLLLKHPDLFQKVSQKYIANMLGISPESLSRIRKRIRDSEIS
jgi:CRP-like cAMP-binding protein